MDYDFVVSIRFENNIPPYIAGQFTKITRLKLDGDLSLTTIWLVRCPHEDFLEVIYVNVLDGNFTPHLYRTDTNDSIFVMDKASGFFIMDEVPSGD